MRWEQRRLYRGGRESRMPDSKRATVTIRLRCPYFFLFLPRLATNDKRKNKENLCYLNLLALISTRVCKDSENTDSGFTRRKFQDWGWTRVFTRYCFLCQFIIKYLNRNKILIISILSFTLYF